MVTRQGDTYRTVKSAANPEQISVSLKDPHGNTVFSGATPIFDEELYKYVCLYTFPVDASLGNWIFTWTVDGETSDEVINLQPQLTSRFVDIPALKVRLNQYKELLERTGILQQGINSGDNFITRNFNEDELPDLIPEEIVLAATLWAAKDIIITRETGTKEDVATVKEYKQEAKDIIKKYIESHPEEAEDTKIGRFSSLI